MTRLGIINWLGAAMAKELAVMLDLAWERDLATGGGIGGYEFPAPMALSRAGRGIPHHRKGKVVIKRKANRLRISRRVRRAHRRARA